MENFLGKNMNSYDVFDTLIARRFVNNDPILLSIQQITQIPNFAEQRKMSDDGTRSLYQIYEDLANKGVIKSEQLMNFYKLETELEKSHTFGIKENIKKVRDGDLLISDMYFSGADILQLVRFAGCDKQVTIYQSNSDKRTGVLWDRLKDKNLIDVHLGDNIISDVENPRARGIRADHYIDAIQLTGVEQVLHKNKMDLLACLIREVRLKRNEEEYNFFAPSNQLNLPLLVICSELLFRRHKSKKIVFLGRDCQLLYKIYNAFYENAYYIPFSRKIAYAQPTEASAYLKAHMPPNSVLIDMSSTGATWEKICKVYPFDIEVVIYSDLFHYTKEKPVLPNSFSWIFKNSDMGQTNEMVEVFNCGDHGVIEEVIDCGGGVYTARFGNNEMKSEQVAEIHSPINIAVETSKNYSDLRLQMATIPVSELEVLFSKLILQLCSINLKLEDYQAAQEKYMSEVRNAKNS
jgi:hypothetical protein